MSFLFDGLIAVTWQQTVMYGIGLLLIYLAIRKNYEPSLLLPMGFGAILVNLPFSGVLDQTVEGIGEVQGIIEWMYNIGIAPSSVALVGFLMFGNLLRECGVLDSLSESAQKVLANLVTLFLGITISFSMVAEQFVNIQTLMIMGLGLAAFIFDTVAGVAFAKFMNLFTKNKINPMVGAAGISAFPMSSRVIQKLGQKEDGQNFLLMHAVGVNVSGQIASVLAGGIILSIVPQLIK